MTKAKPNKSMEGHPKDCDGDIHYGQNGTWKCWKCGMIGGGFNDAPQPTNKSIEDVVEEFKELGVMVGEEDQEPIEDFLQGKYLYDAKGNEWELTAWLTDKLTSLVQKAKEEERERIKEMIEELPDEISFEKMAQKMKEIHKSLSNTPKT